MNIKIPAKIATQSKDERGALVIKPKISFKDLDCNKKLIKINLINMIITKEAFNPLSPHLKSNSSFCFSPFFM